MNNELLTVVVSTIILTILIIFLTLRNSMSDDNILKVIFASVFVSFILSVIIVGACFGIIRSGMEKEEVVYEHYDLVALDSNEDINAHFFVGSGYINENLYYHFFYKEPNSPFVKYTKIMSEYCYITEYDGKPSYKKYGTVLKDKSSFFYEPNIINETKDVLFIPKGTIKSNYKVN